VRRIGILLSGLAGALAIGAGAAGSAAAEAPEYGRCVNVAVHGKVGAFKNGGCTIAATATEHKFEWEPGPGPKPKFVSHMTSEKAIIETAGGSKVSCTKLHDAGEVTGLKTTVTQLTFEGCASSGLPCTTPGQAAGVIATPVLSDKLIVIKKEATATKAKIGDDISNPTGAPFLEFECGPARVVIDGSWIWSVKTNAMVLKATLKFAAAGGIQKPNIEKGEGEPKDILEASFAGKPFERVGLTFTEVQENEEKIEVNTVV
jgi:hypothetical protein